MLGDVAHQVEALAVGQAHVGEAQVEASLAAGARFASATEPARSTAEAHPDERELEQLADVGLVVDDQHGCFARRATLRPLHARTPRPSDAEMRARHAVDVLERAPFAAHSSRAMYRPRPVPSLSVVKNGSNSWPLRSLRARPGRRRSRPILARSP